VQNHFSFAEELSRDLAIKSKEANVISNFTSCWEQIEIYDRGCEKNLLRNSFLLPFLAIKEELFFIRYPLAMKKLVMSLYLISANAKPINLCKAAKLQHQDRTWLYT